MAITKKSKTNNSYFPESVPACYHTEEGFVVPYEAEEYYARIWKWKLERMNQLEPFKRKWLDEYEKKTSKITHWRSPEGVLISL